MATEKKRSLGLAKTAKNDEFYTLLDSVNDELYYYTTDREDMGLVNQFKGKTVFCNCDDPEWSAFWKYFVLNFHTIGLKKLISTHYDPSGKPSYKMEYAGKEMNGQKVLIKTDLQGNGDFRNEECIEILKEADIVVTNPPFSLFREYVAQLVHHKKKFVVIGNLNCAAYKEVFPLLKDNKLWGGYSFNKTMEFIMPDTYKLKGKAFIDNEGRKHGFVPGICWYTNLDVKYRHDDLPICDYYYGNEQKYPHYSNYDAIHVKALDDIPCDYEGAMGVPITIFGKLNPDQFEVIGLGITSLGKEIGVANYDRQYKTPASRDGTLYYVKDGKGVVPFARVLVRNKHPRPRKGEK